MSQSNGPLLSERLGVMVAETQLDGLPSDVVEYGKRLLLDTLTCMVGGQAFTARQQAMVNAATACGGAGTSTALVSGEQLSPMGAAMVNSEAGSVLAASDSFFFSHASTMILANALALTEAKDGNGKELLMAYLMGLETACVLNIMAPSNLPPTSVGAAEKRVTDAQRSSASRLNYVAIGAAAAAARAIGLDAVQTAHALSIAAVTAPPRAAPPTTRQRSVNYMSYYPQTQTSMAAAQVAKHGFTGHLDVLEQLLDTPLSDNVRQVDQQRVAGRIGSRWWILEDSIKRYPSCRYVGGPLELFEKIRDREQLTADEITYVGVRVTPLVGNFGPIADASYEPDADDPDTLLDLPFNTPYLIAMLAYGYPPGPEWYDPQKIADPSVRDFMQRVRLEIDEPAGEALREKATASEHLRVAESGATGLVVEARGARFEETCGHVYGDPWSEETRATDEFHTEKARNYLDPFLPAGRAEQLVEHVLSIEKTESLTPLVALLSR
ncbi:hypothetical protein D0Z08_14740 [Nocardioides immobilis]|uniref:MmgE/PrpD family protein n=1 Tax=Nocardioides immobilis TaxID=2049295 RepID=A0A417Y0X2_9ACTN|nr:MmgE/PrpD family protein [Nocardioides immobilis]RHW26231.1 hypothetical protein D0Z08_14740 [Nocardioides immobilis]